MPQIGQLFFHDTLTGEKSGKHQVQHGDPVIHAPGRNTEKWYVINISDKPLMIFTAFHIVKAGSA